MLFNSIEFAIFLPIVFAIFWLLRKKIKWQNIALLLASYVFYAWWDWRFLGLLFGMSFFSWFCGKMVVKSNEELRGGQNVPFASKLWLIANIVIDLMVLGTFKYYNFFVDSFADLFAEQHSFPEDCTAIRYLVLYVPSNSVCGRCL